MMMKRILGLPTGMLEGLNTVLSSCLSLLSIHGCQQPCTVGEASLIDPDTSLPVKFHRLGGQQVRNLALFTTSLDSAARIALCPLPV